MKPRRQTTGNVRVIWSHRSPFTLFPTSGRVCVWRTAKEAYNPECLVPTVKHGRGSVTDRAEISWWHYYPSWPNYYKGVRGQVG
jgi:hypothetical protein